MKKYRALRIISTIYTLCCGFVLAGSILVGGYQFIPVYSSYYGMPLNSPALGVATIISGILLSLGLLAIAELLNLLIDLEENTRTSAKHTEQSAKYLNYIAKQFMLKNKKNGE